VAIHRSEVDTKVPIRERTGESALGLRLCNMVDVVLATLGIVGAVATAVSRHERVDGVLVCRVASEHTLHVVGVEGRGVKVNMEAAGLVNTAASVLQGSAEALNERGMRSVVGVEDGRDELNPGEASRAVVERSIALGFKPDQTLGTEQVSGDLEGVAVSGGEPALDLDTVLHDLSLCSVRPTTTLPDGVGFLNPFRRFFQAEMKSYFPLMFWAKKRPAEGALAKAAATPAGTPS